MKKIVTEGQAETDRQTDKWKDKSQDKRKQPAGEEENTKADMTD